MEAPNIDAGPLTLSPFQQRAACVPEAYDLVLDGGRGGGKSHLLAFLIVQHVQRYGSRARVLYVRQTLASLRDFEDLLREILFHVFGTAARFNASEHVWRLPTGAQIELGHMREPGDYRRYQGRSFTLLVIDEATQWPTPDLIDRLRSNLRSVKGVPLRTLLAMNPGEIGHSWALKRYVRPAEPWVPCVDPVTGAEFVRAPSTFRDNPAIDAEDYERKLRAACADDPELLKAWLSGDWNIARGAFFGSVIDESRNMLEPTMWADLCYEQRRRARPPENWLHARRAPESVWDLFLAHDYGSAAPSVTLVCARSPGTTGADGRYYPAGSILLLDELATNRPDSLTEGMQYTVPRLADEIRELAERWGIAPRGVADDACFAQTGHNAGSIADEFAQQGVFWTPARKGDRLSGWQRMRTMLANAGKPDVPGLYVSRACRYWWQTVPSIPRDPRRPEDVDTRGPDHAADACRYGLLRESGRALLMELT